MATEEQNVKKFGVSVKEFSETVKKFADPTGEEGEGFGQSVRKLEESLEKQDKNVKKQKEFWEKFLERWTVGTGRTQNIEKNREKEKRENYLVSLQEKILKATESSNSILDKMLKYMLREWIGPIAALVIAPFVMLVGFLAEVGKQLAWIRQATRGKFWAKFGKAMRLLWLMVGGPVMTNVYKWLKASAIAGWNKSIKAISDFIRGFTKVGKQVSKIGGVVKMGEFSGFFARVGAFFGLIAKYTGIRWLSSKATKIISTGLKWIGAVFKGVFKFFKMIFAPLSGILTAAGSTSATILRLAVQIGNIFGKIFWPIQKMAV